MTLSYIPSDTNDEGILKATASGVLPSGQPVVVNADGTVSVVAETSISATVGTAAAFDTTTSASEIHAIYDSSSQKVVVSYRDGLDSTRGYAAVGTVSGNSISFGTPVRFTTRTIEWSSCTYDSVNSKVVIAYADQANPRYGYAIVGDVSGTSISFGSETVFNAYETQHIAIGFDEGAGKVVIVYEDWGNSNYGLAIVGTVSGTSISFGSEVVYESSRTQKPTVVYDANAQKTVICFSSYGDSEYGQGIVGTVSGTSISFGTKTQFEPGVLGETTSTYDSNAQKIVVVYRDQSGSNNGTVAVGTVSGTSISFGTPVVFHDAYATEIGATYDASVGKIVITYRDASNSSYGMVVTGTVSGTSVSFDPETVFSAVSTRYTSVTYDANAKKAVIAFKDGGGSAEGEALVYQLAGSATNLTSENYIGMSGGAVKTLSQSEAIGTESTFETGAVYSSASGYHVAEKKTLLMFRDASDSSKIKGRLVTTTGTTLSYGSIVEVTGQVGGFESGAVVYDSVNEKLVVIFRGNTNYSYAVVATISGSSLTFGTPVVFNSATSYVTEGVYDSSSGKIVVAYSAASVSYLKVGTVSGTSISFGSATSLGSGSGMYYGKLAYDPVNDKTIYVQVNETNADGIAYVGTVSGTSISVGSPTTFNSNLADIYGAFYDAPSGKIGVIVQTGGGPGEGYVGTVSGTSISFGSGVQFQSGISQGTTGYDSRVNKFTVACRSINSPYPGLLRLGTISGNTFSFASPVTFNSGETSPRSVGFDSDQGTSIIAFMDGGDGDVGKAIGYQAAGTYLARGQVADGGAAITDIIGTVSRNQVGLTAGQAYYVQTDGTIGTTPADPSVFAGTAISATKLIVKT